jgi:hypothetical protein
MQWRRHRPIHPGQSHEEPAFATQCCRRRPPRQSRSVWQTIRPKIGSSQLAHSAHEAAAAAASLQMEWSNSSNSTTTSSMSPADSKCTESRCCTAAVAASPARHAHTNSSFFFRLCSICKRFRPRRLFRQHVIVVHLARRRRRRFPVGMQFAALLVVAAATAAAARL